MQGIVQAPRQDDPGSGLARGLGIAGVLGRLLGQGREPLLLLAEASFRIREPALAIA